MAFNLPDVARWEDFGNEAWRISIPEGWLLKFDDDTSPMVISDPEHTWKPEIDD